MSEGWEEHQEIVELGERIEAKLDRIIALLERMIGERPVGVHENDGVVESRTYVGTT